MLDVAAEADVSLKTVSRVVNGEQHVSTETSDRVTRAIDALGYQVDDRARRLRRRDATTGTIGFVLDDVANDFFAAILRGLEDVAGPNGCLVLAGSTDGDAYRERALIDAFVSRRVDGLVVVTSDVDSPVLRTEIERGTPVVVVDLEPPRLTVDVVRSDHHAGARLGMAHLVAQGHRDIAFLGDELGIFSADERLRGYTDAMRHAGLEVRDDRVVRQRTGAEGWTALAGTFLDRGDPPGAVFTAQNFVTIGLVRALHARGLQRDVAVVGHDDVTLAEVVEPGITVVPQRPRELGRRAATRLFERLAGDRSPPTRVLLEPRLVVRGSGELPART